MPKGNLLVQITDMRGGPIRQRVDIDLRPVAGQMGTGGEPMELSVSMGASTELEISGIFCRGGIPTTYRIAARTPHFRTYSFFQPILENRVNQPMDDVEFWIKPGDVTDVQAPEFPALPAKLRSMLVNADMRDVNSGDSDLFGSAGAALYQKLGPLRKAALLNIAKKAGHPTAANCFESFGELLVCRQDRIFARIDPGLPAQLTGSPMFKSADPGLHDALPGYRLTGESFKSRDDHANLQVTIMQSLTGPDLAADIDIDESSGIEHGLEVIGNAVFRKKTNPYLIREFMLEADFLEHTLDPGYDFVV